ncbi:hypothetical protein C2U72_05325, partial [Prosthecomicrobium hirschii]|uniref:hypothetical protein n=1 Tax=Prosthecodimorpha hirschii TaxID=665126 RepID=UPI001AEF0685
MTEGVLVFGFMAPLLATRFVPRLLTRGGAGLGPRCRTVAGLRLDGGRLLARLDRAGPRTRTLLAFGAFGALAARRAASALAGGC